MAEARVVNPLVEQFQKGGVPRELRMLAAQGALPLKPVDLLELLYFLITDVDAAVSETAQASLKALPAGELLPVLKDRATPPELLAWGLSNREERELREAVLQNTSTPDEAIEAQAPALSEALAELVVINQVRLLRRTSLLKALESNAGLNNDQRRRLRELRESFRIGEEPAPETFAPPPPPPPQAEPPPPAVEEVPFEAPPLAEDQAVVHYLTEEERKQPDKVSAVQRLYRLNAAQKVIAALKGTREERAVLIRDPNRIVSSAVLGSPKVTDAEIESFAAMKSVSDELLRQIGTNRDWTKRYGVVSNLVKNPRTPLGLSLGLVPRMNPRDMKGLTTDRNVPEGIRKAALRFVRAAQAGPGEKEKP
jgi:hypothetical protein